MSFVTPYHLRPGSEGWTSYSNICFNPAGLDSQALIRMDAPLWPDGDQNHRVLVTRNFVGNLTVWTEDTPEARTEIPACYAQFVAVAVEVPSVQVEDVFDAFDGEV